jgi:peptidoglycan hydrolase-like protein with peptidoglycan-binding domain
VKLTKELKRGDRESQVKKVQEWFSLHGERVPIDGIFGPVTESVVKAFQAESGLAATGIVDAITFDYLVEMHKKDKEARDKIIQSIATSKFRWRTPMGIAKESALSIKQVIGILEQSDAFIRARRGNDRGEPLYTTKDKYKSESSIGQRILTALTNKISA